MRACWCFSFPFNFSYCCSLLKLLLLLLLVGASVAAFAVTVVVTTTAATVLFCAKIFFFRSFFCFASCLATILSVRLCMCTRVLHAINTNRLNDNFAHQKLLLKRFRYATLKKVQKKLKKKTATAKNQATIWPRQQRLSQYDDRIPIKWMRCDNNAVDDGVFESVSACYRHNCQMWMNVWMNVYKQQQQRKKK